MRIIEVWLYKENGGNIVRYSKKSSNTIPEIILAIKTINRKIFAVDDAWH